MIEKQKGQYKIPRIRVIIPAFFEEPLRHFMAYVFVLQHMGVSFK